MKKCKTSWERKLIRALIGSCIFFTAYFTVVIILNIINNTLTTMAINRLLVYVAVGFVLNLLQQGYYWRKQKYTTIRSCEGNKMKKKIRLVRKIEWRPINDTSYKIFFAYRNSPDTFKHVWLYGLLCSIPLLGQIALLGSGLEWWFKTRKKIYQEE